MMFLNEYQVYLGKKLWKSLSFKTLFVLIDFVCVITNLLQSLVGPRQANLCLRAFRHEKL